MYAQVIVPLFLPSLTYRVPEGLELRPGDAVNVLVRKKLQRGVVLSLSTQSPADASFEIHEIRSRAEQMPRLSEEQLRMLAWCADYYHYPIGDVLRAFLPAHPEIPTEKRFRLSEEGARRLADSRSPTGKRQQQLLARLRSEKSITASGPERVALRRLRQAGLVEEYSSELSAAAEVHHPGSSPYPLTEAQERAVSAISAALEERTFHSFLLQGVTGSGKTEVYLRAAERCLGMGRNVLVIVPEIALTPQLLARFRERLGGSIAMLHSGISDGERSRQWHSLHRGQLRVCIGARSAALAPAQNLGLIIVDEEHDSALKQEDHLKYHGRDLAVIRARNSGAVALLGSATPSLESLHNCSTGRYRHLLLPERAGGQALPAVRVIDRRKTKEEGSVSAYLQKEIRDALLRGEQAMLLLNRRGFSSFLLCSACGFVPECPNCSVSLTSYKARGELRCHYCSYHAPTPRSCSACDGSELRPGTMGTESLEAELASLFPEARLLRIDRESMERKGALEEALGKIAGREVDIIVGTQMIAKGHDFPFVSLVGVVNADTSFHLPDFRASERSFQLFIQMAGRAGRGGVPGRVVIQTYCPSHPSITHAIHHDFRSFSEAELRVRHAFAYPPYSRMARLLLSGGNAAEVEQGADALASQIQRLQHGSKEEVMVTGPSPAIITRIQNRTRWQLLLRAGKPEALHGLLRNLLAGSRKLLPRRVSLQVDVDPVSLM